MSGCRPFLPGECPPQTSGRRLCTTSCNSDSNCPTNEKCCSNGCGHHCTPPYTGIFVCHFLIIIIIIIIIKFSLLLVNTGWL
uniref:WAP domain-containing protein n=1 Tax=Cyprinus carpio TaxID=7962 RepID=A0A8C2DVS3_CYPCA